MDANSKGAKIRAQNVGGKMLGEERLYGLELQRLQLSALVGCLELSEPQPGSE